MPTPFHTEAFLLGYIAKEARDAGALDDLLSIPGDAMRFRLMQDIAEAEGRMAEDLNEHTLQGAAVGAAGGAGLGAAAGGAIGALSGKDKARRAIQNAMLGTVGGAALGAAGGAGLGRLMRYKGKEQTEARELMDYLRFQIQQGQ